MKNTVLITGASSGIGREIATLLAKEGYQVFAGVRSKADKIKVEKVSKNIHGVYLDVSSQESIDKAFWYVLKKTDGLDAIINNAGIAVFGPLEYLPVDKIKESFNTNTFGALAVTQKFLPILSAGKIINMSSISACGFMPFIAPYAASKIAMDVLFNNMLLELNDPDIRIVSIKPCSIRTPIWDKSIKKAENFTKYLPNTALEKYKKELSALLKNAETNSKTAIEPEVVAKLVLKILKDKNPKLSYTLRNKDWWTMVFAKFPLWIINFFVRFFINLKIKRNS